MSRLPSSFRVLPAALCFAAVTWPAAGQSLPGLSGIERPDRSGVFDLLLPKLAPESGPGPVLELPPRMSTVPLEQPMAGPQFFVKSVRVEGGTVFSEEELADVTGPFVGRVAGAAELEELRQRLTRLYVDRGYINSGAILPDQDVQDGIVTYRIIEGSVTDIEVIGAGRLFPYYIESRLALDAGPPFRVEDIANRLHILSQDPAVGRISIDIQPGATPGEARLLTKVEEAKHFRVSTTFANGQAPSVGDIRGDGDIEARNVFGAGEALRLRYGKTMGVNDRGAVFSLPVTPWDTVLHVKYDQSSAGVIQADLVDLGIRSRTVTYEAGITQPIYRTPENSITLGAAFSKRESRSYLLGDRFTFSPGVSDGLANINVVRFSQEFQNRSRDHAAIFRSTVSKGLLAFGSTKTDAKPDGDFMAWLGQARVVHRLFDDIELQVRADAQVTDRPLFGLEQFSLGGMNTIRGYRENEVVADDGMLWSVELKIPIFEYPLPEIDYVFDENAKVVISLAPFYDEGRAWSQKGSTNAQYLLRSAGIGAKVDIGDVVAGQFYYGKHLRRVISHPDRTAQDDGLHFRVSTTLRF